MFPADANRELFTSAQLRIKRATEHSLEFANIWSEYLDESPFQLRLDTTDNARYCVAVETLGPIPAALGVVFSEWLSCLRFALDNALYDLAVVDSGGQDPPPNAEKLQFPITTTPEGFEKQSFRLAELSKAVRTRIERGQPYHAQPTAKSSSLWQINELARIDRHRVIHVAGATMVDPKLVADHLPAGYTIEFGDIRPDVGDTAISEITEFTMSPPLPNAGEYVEPDVWIAPEVPYWRSIAEGPASEVGLDVRMRETESAINRYVLQMIEIARTVHER